MLEDLRSISSIKKDIQNFSRVVGSTLILVGVLSFLFGGERFAYFFIAGGGLVLAGVFVPMALRPIQHVWMMLSVVLGLVMTRVILGVFFYLVITPIGLLARIAGKRFLDTAWKSSISTYWVARETTKKSKESYTQQF